MLTCFFCTKVSCSEINIFKGEVNLLFISLNGESIRI